MDTVQLKNGEQRTTIDIAAVAKLVRGTLKHHFGKFPFSIKSKRYSGGSSITVYWADGPTASRVNALIGHFCGADFDSMTDLKTYHDTETRISPDGTIRHIRYGNDYIFTQRRISNWDAREAEAVAYIRAHCHTDGNLPHDKFGNEWVRDVARRLVNARDYLNQDTIETGFRRAVLRETC